MKQILWNDDLETYSLKVGIQDQPILKKIREQAKRMPEGHMQISPLQGQYLRFLVALLKPQKILEIGTYTGYSTLSMALALEKNAQIVTCDRNHEWTKLAKGYWKEAGVDAQITFRLGDALEIMQSYSPQSFDFIFIDADKRRYDAYYEKGLSLLKNHGVMVIDNVLWSGRVASLHVHDELTEILRILNKKIATDERINFCVLPVGDGMTMVRKNAA